MAPGGNSQRYRLSSAGLGLLLTAAALACVPASRGQFAARLDGGGSGDGSNDTAATAPAPAGTGSAALLTPLLSAPAAGDPAAAAAPAAAAGSGSSLGLPFAAVAGGGGGGAAGDGDGGGDAPSGADGLLEPLPDLGLPAAELLQQSAPDPDGMAGPAAPPPPPPEPFRSSCLPYNDAALDRLDRALRSALLGWGVQRGAVAFLSDDGKECGGNCAFSNPNLPYGLTLLPPAPVETQRRVWSRLGARSAAVADRRDGLPTAPPTLAQPNGSASPVPGMTPIYQLTRQEVVLVAGCLPPSAASDYFSATPYLHSAWNADSKKWVTVFGSMSDSASLIRNSLAPLENSAASVASAANLSASLSPKPAPPPRIATFPLRRTSPAELMLQAAADAVGGLGTGGLLGRGGSGPLWTPGALLSAATASASSSSSAAAATPRTMAQSSSTPGAGSGTGSSGSGSSGGGPADGSNGPPPSPDWDQFFVTAMTASPAAALTVTRALQSVLTSLADTGPASPGLTPTPDPSASASTTAPPDPTYSGPKPRINVLPIPGPMFGTDMGLDPDSPYFGLMLRSIVPAGAQQTHFAPYAAATPLRAWRLSPPATLPSLPQQDLLLQQSAPSPASSSSPSSSTTPGSGSSGSSSSAGSSAGSTTAGDAAGGLLALRLGSAWAAGRLGAAAAGDGGGDTAAAAVAREAVAAPDLPLAVLPGDQFGLPPVIPRKPVQLELLSESGGRAGRRPEAAPLFGAYSIFSTAEAQLAPAFEKLQAAVQGAHERDYALGWSLITGSPLSSLDPPVDWGLQCKQQLIDYCNGDNRDATYISAFPYVTMRRPGSRALLVGAHHVMTGIASYMSIAITDPAQRLGLAAFDTMELYGSAAPYLRGTPYEALAPYFYVASFARDCTGVPHCKLIPTSGPRSAPLTRPLLVTLRAYSNPETGVGPDPDDLLKFMTVDLTPRAEARVTDTRERVPDPAFFARDGCASALLGQVLCTAGPDPACCKQVQKWTDTGCWCAPTGKALVAGLGPVQGRAMLTATARLCRVTRPAVELAEC
ncbi:hypothetical protein HYH03_017059 [Edaphochlamys debaryana]|uniref:Uncharacterized protein n=1 Tax=Edaphochlamys debaryana TaxID=47281 RepID=A0A836BPM9_9CHLO|nr:hypothetical protein HYH03_017059 [Edaphochlamys debaryana]|eukprot:KAG2484107.1 hypothetical protein HYH03_017059 [Edaphochlamys debaryana]